MTNTFKQTHRKLTAISHCESSGVHSVSMVLAHTFTGYVLQGRTFYRLFEPQQNGKIPHRAFKKNGGKYKGCFSVVV